MYVVYAFEVVPGEDKPKELGFGGGECYFGGGG